jgi:hypothetical protein
MVERFNHSHIGSRLSGRIAKWFIIQHTSRKMFHHQTILVNAGNFMQFFLVLLPQFNRPFDPRTLLGTERWQIRLLATVADVIDKNRLWAGLRFGEIDTLASDHAARKLAQKLDQDSLKMLPGMPVMPGLANVETMMPMLYSEGVTKGRISLDRFVEVTSTNPAKLFGMFPRKGTISVGSDADLVVWDPNEVRTIRAKEMHSKADFDLLYSKVGRCEGGRLTQSQEGT